VLAAGRLPRRAPPPADVWSSTRQGATLAEALLVQAGLLPSASAPRHVQALAFLEHAQEVPLHALPAIDGGQPLPPPLLARAVRAVFRELGLVGAHVRATRRSTGLGAGCVLVRLPVTLDRNHTDCVQAVDGILARVLPHNRERLVLL
jgi:hypothetical protein